MASAGVHVLQQFTTNHEAAVNASRLPREGLSTMDSPYLSLISLVKGWPEQNIRRQDLEQEKQTDQPFITACLPSDQKQRQTTTRAGGHLHAQHERTSEPSGHAIHGPCRSYLTWQNLDLRDLDQVPLIDVSAPRSRKLSETVFCEPPPTLSLSAAPHRKDARSSLCAPSRLPPG